MSTESVSSRAIPIEQIVSVNPFVVSRRIAFRDCDPAGIVYTPRYLDPIATSAVDLFMGELIGGLATRDKPVKGLDLPAKALKMVFHSPTRHGEQIDLIVSCSRIGNTTFDLTIVGRGDDHAMRFECTITLICVDSTEFRSIPVPAHLKDRLQPYLEQTR